MRKRICRNPLRWLLFVALWGLTAGDLCAQEPVLVKAAGELMEKAEPVWVGGREGEMNLTLGFRGVFKGDETKSYRLKITASTLYRLFLNGEFVGYGPARAAHGWFRVDEYDLGQRVTEGENVVAIEVAGYNVNSYYTIDQPSFLQAEVTANGGVLLATGAEGGFEAFEVKERLQKCERYSFQRPFTEYYRLNEGYDRWRSSAAVPVIPVKLNVVPQAKLLERNLEMPAFNVVSPVKLIASGEVEFRKPEKYLKDRSLERISPKFKGYREEELEVLPSQMMQELVNRRMVERQESWSGKSVPLKGREFLTFDLGANLTGFIGATLTCSEPSTLCIHFDEILTHGDVNSKKRMSDVNNQVIWELAPGTYHLESFEAYTMKYLKLILLKGKCDLTGIYLREYAYPLNPLATFSSSSDTLNAIYAAARQTYRQNSVDIFMDCPSRERAGWLCDSYFSAIMERDFTGGAKVAHNFYENYALPERFDHLPEGMIPMCYPADHPNGTFIPNWSMWFILQIEDYARRGGDPLLVARLKTRITNLLGYFEKFENRDGLLESLESWIFVEWSKANEWVRDVNYPTNMLYSAALESAAHLYGNDLWKKKAEKIRKTILKQSYNGTFFVDNAVRDARGKLQVTRNTSEVCQYYAFFFGIATPESHPELWNRLIHEFGPLRNDKVTYPDVFRANAFVGNYLRLDILSRYGLQKQLLGEVKDYFYYMAERTGTLWENTSSHASCNHGFASYIGHLLYRDVLGLYQIDPVNREVTLRFSALALNSCRGSVPVEQGVVELAWVRQGNKMRYTLKVPENYRVKIENPDSLELIPQYDAAIHFGEMYNQAELRYRFSGKTKADFDKWQEAFLPELKKKLGLDRLERQFAGYIPKAEMRASEDVGYAVREHWVIFTEPTVPLPFILLRPKNPVQGAGLVIAPHGHSRNTELYAGIYENEEEREKGEVGERNVAVQAVKEGYFAIAPTVRGFGETRTLTDQKKEATSSCRVLLLHDILVGRTPIGDRVWDISRLIDWALINLPVDPAKIAVTGNSGGGTVTLFAAACEPRIAVAVPSSYFCTFTGSIGSIHHCECNYVPGIMDLGEMADVAGLTAPRAFCAVHGELDVIFPIGETRKAFAHLQEIYKAAGVPGNCELYVGAGGHRYYKDGVWPFVKKHFDKP